MNKTDLKKLDVVSLEKVVGGLHCGAPEIVGIAGCVSTIGLLGAHWIFMGAAYKACKNNNHEKFDKYWKISKGLQLASGVTFLVGLAGTGVSLYKSHKRSDSSEIQQ